MGLLICSDPAHQSLDALHQSLDPHIIYIYILYMVPHDHPVPNGCFNGIWTPNRSRAMELRSEPFCRLGQGITVIESSVMEAIPNSQGGWNNENQDSWGQGKRPRLDEWIYIAGIENLQLNGGCVSICPVCEVDYLDLFVNISNCHKATCMNVYIIIVSSKSFRKLPERLWQCLFAFSVFLRF